jgi:hypothetical protein
VAGQYERRSASVGLQFFCFFTFVRVLGLSMVPYAIIVCAKTDC